MHAWLRTAAALTTAALLNSCSGIVPDQDPAPYATRPEAWPFQIGGVQAWALREGAKRLANDTRIFGVGQTPEAVDQALEARGLAANGIDISFQPLLLRTGNRLILLDAGSVSNAGPGVGLLVQSLRQAGYDPDDVTDVVISHGHPDHAGGLATPEGTATFPVASIHISAEEWDQIQRTPALAKVTRGIAAQVLTFTPGDSPVPGIETIDLSGHTPGHVGIRIRSDGDSLFYVGDGLHHPVLSVDHPEWPMVFDRDPAITTGRRLSLMTAAAESGERLYVTHFPYPGIGRIQQSGAGYAWVPEY